jgi:hypothetical protein
MLVSLLGGVVETTMYSTSLPMFAYFMKEDQKGIFAVIFKASYHTQKCWWTRNFNFPALPRNKYIIGHIPEPQFQESLASFPSYFMLNSHHDSISSLFTMWNNLEILMLFWVVGEGSLYLIISTENPSRS